MKAHLLSILVGSEVCNARCPFCISKMTPPQGITLEEPQVNWRNFRKSCILARNTGITTAMLTSKGEPTLYPEQITRYLEAMKEFEFPLIELQTNGILLAEQKEKYRSYLKKWYELGMTTIAISVVHYDAEKNRKTYLPHKKQYVDLPSTIAYLHEMGFSVRLACVMARGWIDSPEEVKKMIAFAKQNKIEQLTFRPVNKPNESRNQEVWDWTSSNFLLPEQKESIQSFIEKNGVMLLKYAHGAIIYDLDGQNVCIANSLTLDLNAEEMRQLIFFPDGHLRYDWQYTGALLL